MSEAKIGVRLRHQHFPYLLDRPKTEVKWFEAITENFLETKGRPLSVLEKIREDYPVGLHGVSLNLGSYEPLDKKYLKEVKDLYNFIDPFIISDHLCWTGLKQKNLHNLLPLPYNEETLNFLVNRITEFQDYVGRQMAVENLSAYLEVEGSTYTEWDFLNELANRSGCKILLDLNNVYVNSQNQDFDPYLYVDAIEDKNIGEIHLAGFSDMGDFLFDTHSNPVFHAVWDLFHYKIKNLKEVPILVEWDEEIPEFKTLEAEANKAHKIWKSHHEK